MTKSAKDISAVERQDSDETLAAVQVHSQHHLKPHVPTVSPILSPTLNPTLSRALTRSSTRPDLSFPGITTDTNQGGFSDEYRVQTNAGFVRFDALPEEGGLTRSISRVTTSNATFVGDDPEKAKRLKEVKLVTWKIDDKEDPRSWSNTWRWGEWMAKFLVQWRSNTPH